MPHEPQGPRHTGVGPFVAPAPDTAVRAVGVDQELGEVVGVIPGLLA